MFDVLTQKNTIMRKKIFSKCPFCDYEESTIVKQSNGQFIVITKICGYDSNDGCKKEYAIRYKTEVIAYVESSKLEFKRVY